MNAIVGGTGKYVLKPNTSGKADIWKKVFNGRPIQER